MFCGAGFFGASAGRGFSIFPFRPVGAFTAGLVVLGRLVIGVLVRGLIAFACVVIGLGGDGAFGHHVFDAGVPVFGLHVAVGGAVPEGLAGVAGSSTGLGIAVSLTCGKWPTIS